MDNKESCPIDGIQLLKTIANKAGDIKAAQDALAIFAGYFETKIMLLQIVYLLIKNTPITYLDEIGKNLKLKREILSYIDRKYMNKISLKEISDNFHMSEKYFSRYFKNCFKITFVEYVNSVRLEKAASLLSTTDLSVTEVALQCGYTNISYFIRSFKKVFGTSPHVFRKM